MNISTFQLANGIRVVFQPDVSINTVHCGFFMRTGSRDESAEQHGLAHLIEHCLFKGTKRRKAFHILNRIDSVGGEINAFTTKEETCVFTSALKEYFMRSAELLSDVVFNSIFPEKEIEKEKQVIADEINSYRDAPDEQLFDDFEQYLFPDNALGRPILGEEPTLERLDRRTILEFVKSNYSTHNMVFAVVGNVQKSRVERFARLYLEGVQRSDDGAIHRDQTHVALFQKEERKPVHQTHALIGSEAPSMTSDWQEPMVLLTNILGGPALNSRLNLNIREKFGFCYHIEAGYQAYSDTGVFQVYFGTDQKHYAKTRKLVLKELQKFIENSMTSRALTTAQNQLIGQVALARENRGSLMLALGKSMLFLNNVESFDEFVEKVKSITALQLQEVATTVFSEKNLSSLVYLPEKK